MSHIYRMVIRMYFWGRFSVPQKSLQITSNCPQNHPEIGSANTPEVTLLLQVAYKHAEITHVSPTHNRTRLEQTHRVIQKFT